MNNEFLKMIDNFVGKLCSVSNRQVFFVTLAAIFLISFTGVFDHALWTPDEPRAADVAREMLVNGDFIVPTLAGEPFLEKPPLCWWAMAGMYRLFGVSDGVARSTSALAAVMTLLLVFDVARRIANPFAGLMAVLVTATLSGFYQHFHRVVVDPWLALCVMLGYWGFVVALFGKKKMGDEKKDSPSALGIFIVYLAGGLAFLAKGPVGPGLIAVPLCGAILLTRRWNFFRSWAHIPGMFACLAICLWWPFMLYVRGGKDFFINGFFVKNIMFRIFPAVSQYYRGGHGHSFWYYFIQFPGEIMPWAVTLPAVGHWLWRKRWPSEWNGQALVCLFLLFPIGVVLLSIPGTKRGLYLLPLLAPLGIVIGTWVAATAGKGSAVHTIDRYTHIIFFGLLAFAVVVVAVVTPVAYFGGARIFDYFHAVLQYRPSAPMLFIFYGILVILGLGLIAYCMRLWKSGSPRMIMVCAWLTFIVFLCSGSLFYRLGDGVKNLHFLTKGLQTMGVISPELVGYRLDETTMGLIPYDTGFVPKNITTPEELNLYLSATPSGKVLMFEKVFFELPDELRARIHVLRCWHFGDKRSYCLYTWSTFNAKSK